MDVEFVLGLAILGTFLFGLAGPALGGRPQQHAVWRRIAWFPPLLVTVLLFAFVVAEDDYAADGRSRWDVYDAQGTIVPALVLGVLATGFGGAASRRPAAALWAALGCLLVGFAAVLARLQMTN